MKPLEVPVKGLGGGKDSQTRSPLRIEGNDIGSMDGSHWSSAVVRKGREERCLVRD
jgi:hypothetical protein